MSLFNFEKKKEEKKTPACDCPTNEVKNITNNCCGESVNGIRCIKILGAGCATCHQQYEYAKEAIKSMELSVEVEYITDMPKVMEYGVMSMPAIIINEKVVSQGKVIKSADIIKLLNKLGF